MMHPLVFLFLRDYWQWLVAGADPKVGIFSRKMGLCDQFCWYSNHDMQRNHAQITLKRLFKDDGLCGDFPFYGKEDPLGEYCYECEQHITHLNSKRLEWVRGKLEGQGYKPAPIPKDPEPTVRYEI